MSSDSHWGTPVLQNNPSDVAAAVHAAFIERACNGYGQAVAERGEWWPVGEDKNSCCRSPDMALNPP